MNSKIIAVILVLFALMYPASAAIEIRGTVVDVNNEFNTTTCVMCASITSNWNAKNFAAFYYDIDKDMSSETLNVTISNSDRRTIAKNDLVYKTEPKPADFPATKANKGAGTYFVIGWKGEKYVAIDGNANKLAKLAYEMSESDKITVSSGNVWKIGAGYELAISAIDAKAAPRQAWLTLTKDGNKVDDVVVQHSGMYNYTKTILGEQDTLVFTVYVDSIFSGTTSDMVQFKYAWLMDDSNVSEVKTSDSYGLLDVIRADKDAIELKNSDNAISLSKDSVIDIMGTIKFKVADSDTVRYYPKVDISSLGESTVVPTTTSSIVSTPVPTLVPTPVATEAPVPVAPAPVAPAPVAPPAPVATASPTPVATTPAESTPGFEAIFAIAGLVLVSFVVLRNRNR